MASNKVDEQDPLAPIYEAFSSGEDDENDPSAMSLVDHLEEEGIGAEVGVATDHGGGQWDQDEYDHRIARPKADPFA